MVLIVMVCLGFLLVGRKLTHQRRLNDQMLQKYQEMKEDINELNAEIRKMHKKIWEMEKK